MFFLYFIKITVCHRNKNPKTTFYTLSLHNYETLLHECKWKILVCKRNQLNIFYNVIVDWLNAITSNRRNNAHAHIPTAISMSNSYLLYFITFIASFLLCVLINKRASLRNNEWKPLNYLLLSQEIIKNYLFDQK